MSQQLSEGFIVELAKACIISKEILNVVKPHLSYTYLPNPEYKQIFKFLIEYHTATGKSPTVGMLSEEMQGKGLKNGIPIVARIREVNVFDSKDDIVKMFEKFVKTNRFFELYSDVGEMYNKGEQDQAITTLALESQAINEFSITRKMHGRVFADFDERQKERQSKDYTVRKIATGIGPLDYHTRGGFDKGTGVLAVARSGAGKTTWLRHLGGSAAFRGENVLHIAAGDSTEEEIMNGYDAWWTGVDLHSIKEGKIDGSDWKVIEKARKDWLASCGEVFVHVFKQFHTASIADCRGILIELMKEHEIGMVLFDYLEKFSPGDKQKYGTNDEGQRARKLAVAEKMVNIATEFDLVVGTVTQASDIKKENWNDLNYTITRSQISNLRATIDPFAYCVTFNQTEDEGDKEIMRIHEEKLRHYKIYSNTSTYQIAQKRDVGRFIDVPRTNAEFWNPVTKMINFNKMKKVAVPAKHKG